MSAQLTQSRVRELLNYDELTGEFTWRVRRANVAAGRSAGRIRVDGYREIGLDGRLIGAHRLAWIHAVGEIKPLMVIDHINGDKSDNRLENLRQVTASQNGQNRHGPAGKNPFVGVTFDRARCKWRADIKIGNKCVTIGRFDTVEEARRAHTEAKSFHHRIWPELIGQPGAPEVPAAKEAA